MLVREYRPADERALVRLLTALGVLRPERLLTDIATGSVRVWLALDPSGQANAYASGRPWQSRPHILGIGLYCPDAEEGDLAPLAAELARHAWAQASGHDPRLEEAILFPVRDDWLDHLAADGWSVIQQIVRYRREPASTGPIPPPDPSAQIRPFTPDDLAAVLAVEQAAFPTLWWMDANDFRRSAEAAQASFAVATAGGAVIGYLICYHGNPPNGYVGRLGVHPRHQGKGFGRWMLAYALDRLAEKGCEAVELSTQYENQTSRGLYEGFGFVQTGHYWMASKRSAPR